MVFDALNEEPEGHLPDDFADQAANRAGVGPAPAIVWSDVLLLFLIVAALSAILVVMLFLSTVLDRTVWAVFRSVQDLSGYVRLDVVGTAGLVPALTFAVDAVLRWLSFFRRSPLPSS